MSEDAPIHIYHLDELADMPKPEWLIGPGPLTGPLTGLLQRNTLSEIVASKATFKTFLALDWGLCVATGRAWNGHPVVQGNVLHLVGEGASGINIRTAAWQEHNACWLPSPSAWACTVVPIDLLNNAPELVSAILHEFPMGIELLIVDTLARNNTGDENSTTQMSELIRRLDDVRAAIGCTVLVLHHKNRSGGIRGSGTVDAACDTVFLMDRKAKGDAVTIDCDKQKDAEEFEKFTMRRKIVGASMVLEPDDDLSPNVAILTRIVGTAGSHGMTKAEATRLVLAAEPRPFGETTFNDAWKDATEKGVIKPADGLYVVGAKGTLWVRNLAMIDIAG